MNEMTEAVNRLFQHLSSCSNRELLYDLYAYLWDIRGVISLLNSYIKWLGMCNFGLFHRMLLSSVAAKEKSFAFRLKFERD